MTHGRCDDVSCSGHPPLARPMFAHAMGPHSWGGPRLSVGMAAPAARAPRAASSAPTPGGAAPSASGDHLAHLEEAAVVRRAVYPTPAALLLWHTGGPDRDIGGLAQPCGCPPTCPTCLRRPAPVGLVHGGASPCTPPIWPLRGPPARGPAATAGSITPAVGAAARGARPPSPAHSAPGTGLPPRSGVSAGGGARRGVLCQPAGSPSAICRAAGGRSPR